MVTCIGVAAILSVIVFTIPNEIPIGEMAYQKLWLERMAVVFVVCSLLSLCLNRKQYLSFPAIVTWVLIALGGIEAAWGMRQIYGLAVSNHSLYALTGSFYNPGPYSGYLAMIFPLCLHEWLNLKERTERTWVEQGKYYMALGVMLLILCVLPAGMSRSAWMAAAVSGIWVYGIHASWATWLKEAGQKYKKTMITGLVIGGLVLIMIGYVLFQLKAASANGRLLMWKISCLAIAESPVVGHGADGFVSAYGRAQEEYFANGEYSETEELVAGSPEYAFNEYLQAAVEWGVPLTLCGLAAIVMCLYIGIKKRRYGICGAILSLMIFSFSSYPLQLPVFIVTFIALLLACVCGNSRWEWIGLAILAVAVGGFRLKNDLRIEQACREWMNVRVLYNAGAYESGEREYVSLYPLLKERAAFLFEYGHGLHKLRRAEASNRIMREALKLSCDPMILNIMGKNYQQKGDYLAAEECFIRSTHRLPGRIYPYYLLAKLYAEPAFRQPDKFETMKRIVLTKEPKVQSTAIRQMREEVNKMIVKR